ncbi:MAG: 2-succinyl-5-enolpyruvyl-6-hydroxy-3-cyclohexene-1-carboxylic-acid synthase [Chthoniobacterales bacterium]
MTHPTNNHFLGHYILEQLRHVGVETFFLSPGARSAPLVAALRAEETITHFDERGMAYAALGHARVSGKPTVCITTSGSAVANLHPAAVEAFYSEIPLIFLTADRPPRLLDRGANQTIDQQNLLSPSQQTFLNLPVIDLQSEGFVSEHRLRNLLGDPIFRLVQTACSTPAGPVHLNCPFDEPLLPFAENDFDEIPSNINVGDEMPTTQKEAPEIVSKVLLAEKKRTLLLVGQLTNEEQKLKTEILELASARGWAVVVDSLSGLRQISHSKIFSYAHLWSKCTADESLEGLLPEVVFHLGESFVSKTIGEWLCSLTEKNYFHISASPRCRNPYQEKIQKLQIALQDFLLEFKKAPAPASDSRDEAWLKTLQQQNLKIEHALTSQIETDFSEPAIMRLLSENLSSDINLFLGNSMPIRDFDMFASTIKKVEPTYFGNRGASGIDGNIATAFGISAASGKTTLAVLGDLTALHDLNSLALANHLNARVIFIVFNNGGGGIFRFLPLKIGEKQRETFLETPHSFEFSKAAEMFSLHYAAPENFKNFQKFLAQALADNRNSWLIEVRSDRATNHHLHLRIDGAIKKILE